MIRKYLKWLMECIHVILIFSMIVPCIYMMGMERTDSSMYRLYFAQYILIISIIGSKICRERSDTFQQYFVGCTLFGGITSVCAFGLSKIVVDDYISIAYLIYIFIMIFVVAKSEYSVRMNKIEKQIAKEEMDRSWHEEDIFMSKPMMPLIFIFALTYILALNFSCAQVCNISLFSAIVYLLLALLYKYLDTIEQYIEINKGVCQVRNIPQKRLMVIGRLFLVVQVILICLMCIPAFATINNRHYVDYRDWVSKIEPDYSELEEEVNYDMMPEDPMRELMESYKPHKEPSVIVMLIFKIIGITIGVIILFYLLRYIYQCIRDFSRNVSEEDDIIETIEEDDLIERVKNNRFFIHNRQENNIRAQYRRYIRRHSKGIPAEYETPYEIEKAAGIEQLQETKHIHSLYESARYGK